MVGAGSFSQSSIYIDEVDVHVYVFNNSYQVIKSNYDIKHNDDFASTGAWIYGRPAGAWWYAAGSYVFVDAYYGNFTADDISSNLYW